MEVDEEVPRERRIFTAFEKHDEFVATQNELLRSCEDPSPEDREQRVLLGKLSLIVSCPSLDRTNMNDTTPPRS